VLTDADREVIDAAYAGADGLGLEATPIVTVQSGRASAETLRQLGERGFAGQVPVERVAELRSTPGWDAQPELVISVLDGRSVWPDGFEPMEAMLRDLSEDERTLRLVPSTSLMFLPVTADGEDLPAGFEFAREKARTLRAFADALTDGGALPSAELSAGEWPEVGQLTRRASATRPPPSPGADVQPRCPAAVCASREIGAEVRVQDRWQQVDAMRLRQVRRSGSPRRI
jgi:hypothetical protein